MLVMQSIKQFLRDMRSQKLRTLLTVFGIMWGTIAIMLLMAFGTGVKEYHVSRFKGLGEQIAIIWPGLTSQPWEGLPRGRRIRFTEADIENIRKTVPEIERISPEYTMHNVMLASHRDRLRVRLSGVWPEFGPMRNIMPRMGGRFINENDMKEKRRAVFIGNRLAERLFPGEEPVGQTVQVNGVPFVVVGVMMTKEQDSSYGGRDNRNAYIAAGTFHSMYSRRYPDNAVAQAKTDEAMPAVIEGFYEYMAAKYNFDPEDSEALMVWDVTATYSFFNTFFLAFRVFLAGIGVLTLITGGIGVTNIMNVVLEERTREIGIKMAVGARKSTIMFQFLFETILLTFIGGAIGFLLAVLIVEFFPLQQLTTELGTPVIHYTQSLVAVAILGIVAFLAGYFPARRAALLEPVRALKLF